MSQEKDTTLARLQGELKEVILDSTRVDIFLKLGKHQFGRDNYNAEEYLLKAIDFIEDGSYESNYQLAIAYRVLGAVERRKGNYKKTYAYYYKSLKLSSDPAHVATVHHNLGAAKLFQKDFPESLIEFRKAISIWEDLEAYADAGGSYHEIGGIYRSLNQLDSAKFYYDKALKLYTTGYKNDVLQYQYKYHMIQISLGMVLLKEKKNSKALSYFNKARDYFSKPGGDRSRLIIVNQAISEVYYRLGDYNKSLFYENEGLSLGLSEGIKNRISISFKRRSRIYKKIKNTEAALKDYVLYKTYSDSLINAETIKKIQEQELNYEFEQEKLKDSLAFSQEKKEIQLLADNESSKKQLYLALLFLILVSAIVTGVLARKNHIKNSKIAQEKLEKEQLQKELLSKKVKTGDDEAKSLIADNTMRLAFKQELLDRLKEEVISEEDSVKLKQSLQSLTSELQTQIATESKFSTIQNKIEDVNKGFDAKLIELYPKLTKTDRELCALMRLNLSIKEIANIRNSSIDSVKTARYRIRKKLGLKAGEELEYFIQSL